MRPTLRPSIMVALLAVTAACSHEEPDTPYRGMQTASPVVQDREQWRDSVYAASMLRKRHRLAPLKILAIGNSFTLNATYHLPSLIDRLAADSVCVATLTRSGCSLQMHWNSHLADTSDYELQYSDSGAWATDGLATIDAALTMMDWDVITLQQVSGLSGLYNTYEPYLSHLLRLFDESAPGAMAVWHSTWPYREGCSHSEFHRYGNDPETMYRAILNATARATETVDLAIPSTELIWRMRKDYPEVTDGFSADGYHISDHHALYALSCLWHELLIRPSTGKSSLVLDEYPSGVDPDFISRAISIVRDLTE